MIPTETIDRALVNVDAAKDRYPPPHWQALAEFDLSPTAFIAYAEMQASRLATHAAAFDTHIDQPTFVTGWLDGLLVGLAIAREHAQDGG